MGIRFSQAELDELERKGLIRQVHTAPSVPASISEEDFQAGVIEFAKRHLWKVYHTRNSRKSEKGFPDLVMVRATTVYAELKSEDGVVTADQQGWIDALMFAGEEVYVWKPSDWPQIAKVLE